jgi:hypothetical protein
VTIHMRLWTNRPKCSPTHVLSKLVHEINRWIKEPKKCWLLQ